jgi:hypothetical protein
MEAFVRPIDQNEGGKYYVGCFGRSCDGAILKLTIGKLQPVEFIVMGGTGSLPASAARLLSARPRTARPQYNRDETISFTTRQL